MADNISVKDASGSTVAIAAKDKTTYQLPRHLISDGTSDVAVKAASTAPAATDPSLVVAISPNSVNANGQATMANSAPVVIASNQSAIPITDNSGSITVDNAGTFATQATISHGKTIKSVSGTLTADTDVIAAVTSKRIKVIAYSVITTGTSANAAIFKSNGTGGTELWRLFLQAPAASSVFGANLSIAAPSFLFATAAGEKLTLDVGNTDALHYSITYFDDDVS